MKLKNEIVFAVLFILLVMIFSACNTEQLDTDMVDNITPKAKNIAEPTRNIEEANVSYIVAESATITPEAIIEAKYAKYDEETGAVTLNMFGNIIFEGAHDFKILENGKVLFYSDSERGLILADGLNVSAAENIETNNLATNFSENDNIDDLRIYKKGYMLNDLPDFIDSNGDFDYNSAMSYFVSNDSVVAYLIITGQVDIPWNDFSDREYSQELKDYAEEQMKQFEPEVITTTKKLVDYYSLAFVGKAKGRKDYFFDSKWKFLPYDYNNHIGEYAEKMNQIIIDDFEMNPREGAFRPLGRGAAIAEILFYGSVGDEQDQIFNYYNIWREAIKNFEKFNETYSQEALDVFLNGYEKSPVVIANMIYVYINGTGIKSNTNTKDGVKSFDETYVIYHGKEISVHEAFRTFSNDLFDVYMDSNQNDGNSFVTTYAEIFKRINPNTELQE